MDLLIFEFVIMRKNANPMFFSLENLKHLNLKAIKYLVKSDFIFIAWIKSSKLFYLYLTWTLDKYKRQISAFKGKILLVNEIN